MQRPNSKNTRQANAEEKRFHGWLKEHDCCWCGNPGPSIVDHAKGATFKHKKVLIGHRFCLCACYECDKEKTIFGRKQGNESEKWLELEAEYSSETGRYAPDEVIFSIQDWNK